MVCKAATFFPPRLAFLRVDAHASVQFGGKAVAFFMWCRFRQCYCSLMYSKNWLLDNMAPLGGIDHGFGQLADSANCSLCSHTHSKIFWASAWTPGTNHLAFPHVEGEGVPRRRHPASVGKHPIHNRTEDFQIMTTSGNVIRFVFHYHSDALETSL